MRDRLTSCYDGDAERLEHVLAVEEKAIEYAKVWGVDEADASLAALAHDCTKLWNREKHLHFIAEYGIIVSPKSPKLLHAISGALYARENFGASEEVCNAVKFHTSGRENMSVLEKIIYLADKTDKTRDYDEVHIIRELAVTDLDRAVFTAMNTILGWLMKKCEIIDESSIKARNYYCKIVKERKNEN